MTCKQQPYVKTFKTRTMMQEDTELKNFPLYCPKCKQQTLVNVKHFVVSVSIDSAN